MHPLSARYTNVIPHKRISRIVGIQQQLLSTNCYCIKVTQTRNDYQYQRLHSTQSSLLFSSSSVRYQSFIYYHSAVCTKLSLSTSTKQHGRPSKHMTTTGKKSSSSIESFYLRHVPSAYRPKLNEDEETRSKNYHNRNKKNKGTKSSNYAKRKLKQEMQPLLRLQTDANRVLKKYQNFLNQDLNHPITTIYVTRVPPRNTPNNLTKLTAEQKQQILINLQQSEAVYSQLSLKLRQLIVGWSSIRTIIPSSNYNSKLPSYYYDEKQKKRLKKRIPPPPPPPSKHALLHSTDIQQLLITSSPGLQQAESKEQDDVMKASSTSSKEEKDTSIKIIATPGKIANQYLLQLELIRKQRQELIYHSSDTKVSSNNINEEKDTMNSITSWFSQTLTTFFGGTDDISQEKEKPVQELSAHKSLDFTATRRLYLEVMRSLVHWNSDTVKVILADEMDSILSRMNECYKHGNVNCRPSKYHYHFVFTQFQTVATTVYALRAMYLLKRMLSSGDDNNQPTLGTYHKVLKILRNAASNRTQSKVKRKRAVMEAQQLMKSIKMPLSLYTYDLLLDTIYSAGHMVLPDIVPNYVDPLMQQMMSPTSYQRFIGESTDTDIEPQLLKPDDKMTHALIMIFTNTREDRYLQRVKKLFQSLMTTNNDIDNNENIKDEGNVDDEDEESLQDEEEEEYWPTYHAYNSYFNALNQKRKLPFIRNIERESDDSATGNNASTTSYDEDADFATTLLDSMIQRKSSMPSRETFHYLMRLWMKSSDCTKNAGEKGEELLSRMELLGASTLVSNSTTNTALGVRFVNPTFLSYEIALECWANSARKGYPGAARSALMLVNRMESQYNTTTTDNFIATTTTTTTTGGDDDDDAERDGETKKNYNPKKELMNKIYNDNLLNGGRKQQGQQDNEKQKLSFVFSAAIHTCAMTKLETDKDDAFRIGFDLYNKMQEQSIPPSSFVYRDLLYCCLFLLSSGKRKLQLSATVFKAACENGCVDSKVLSALKQVHLELYSSYKEQPEHSAAIGKLKKNYV